MENFRLLRQRSIEGLQSANHAEFADAAIRLWERVAAQIIGIVGEAGFDSMYAHSLFLTRSTFPWLADSAQSRSPSHRLANLRRNLEDEAPDVASEANRLLLTIFTDTLASLIGESVAERVLSLAWGDPCAAHQIKTGDKNG